MTNNMLAALVAALIFAAGMLAATTIRAVRSPPMDERPGVQQPTPGPTLLFLIEPSGIET